MSGEDDKSISIFIYKLLHSESCLYIATGVLGVVRKVEKNILKIWTMLIQAEATSLPMAPSMLNIK